MAGGAEAGDRRGVACAGGVGLGGRAASRREREPGICLAELYGDGRRLSGEPSSVEPAGPALVPVTVAEAPGRGGATPAEGAAPTEIALGAVYRVRVGRGFDEHALRRVLDVPERR